MASSADRNTEVDLTPLLDLVLQMVMFFMVCANFASQQLSMNVLLAQSRYAQEVQPGDDKDSLVINVEVVRDKGQVRQPKVVVINIFGAKPIKFWEASEKRLERNKPVAPDIVEEPQGLFRAQQEIKEIARRLRLVISEREHKPPQDVKIPITVVLRADREIHTWIVHSLMEQCKAAGFPRMELSTLQDKSAPSR
jgi:biopolymer transport protein ExbD